MNVYSNARPTRQLSKLLFANLPLRRFLVGSLFCLLIAATVAAAGSAYAQGPRAEKDSQKTELGIRQKLVQRKMVELETKFTAIAQKIREKNPERADLLVKTYQSSKEQSLTRKMDDVSDLLNGGQYDEAEQKLDEVVGIIESLIRLLTNEKEQTISAKDEMRMLEKFKQRIEQQLQDQRQKTKETQKAADKPETLDKVGAQIKALSGLIEKQSKLIEATDKNENGDASLKQLDKLADKQFEVRKATDELNKNITGEKNSLNKDGSFKGMPESVPSKDQLPSGEKKPSEQGEGESDPSSDPSGEPKGDPKGESKSPDENPEGAKSPGAKPPGDKEKGAQGEQDPAGSKPPAGKPTENKPAGESPPSGESPAGESPSGESPSGESPSGEESKPSDGPPEPAQPGEEALKKASEHQKRAEEKLGSGKPADAKRQQEQALEEMKNALAELEKEKRRVESLPPEVLEQLAKEQRRSRDKSLDLIEEMKQAPKGKQDGEPPNEGDSDQQQPGQEQMSEAEQAQNQAAESMEQGESDQAQDQQKKAEKKMKEALEEIEDRLSQLREETNEEKLARLEARFQEMFDRQQTASAMTIEIEDKRANLGQLRHRDQLLILRLATEELDIRELAQQAYDVLLEDGTSIVFPEVVQDMRTDLQTSASMLQNDKTDQYTQLVQKEIETAILDLLDALKEAQKKKDGGGGGGGGGQGGKQPLLKQSAELKILRMRQSRLNRRTRKLEALQEQPEMKATIDAEIIEAAKMQKKILDMTDNIMKKSQ